MGKYWQVFVNSSRSVFGQVPKVFLLLTRSDYLIDYTNFSWYRYFSSMVEINHLSVHCALCWTTDGTHMVNLPVRLVTLSWLSLEQVHHLLAYTTTDGRYNTQAIIISPWETLLIYPESNCGTATVNEYLLLIFGLYE